MSTTIIKLKIILNSIRREKLKKEHVIGVAVAFTEKETNSDGNTGEMRRRHLQTGTQREHQSANEWRVGCGKKCVIGCEIARVPSCPASVTSRLLATLTTTFASRECTLDNMCIEKKLNKKLYILHVKMPSNHSESTVKQRPMEIHHTSPQIHHTSPPKCFSLSHFILFTGQLQNCGRYGH